MREPIPQPLVDAERRFVAAILTNDPEVVAGCITGDWVLVTPEVGPVPAERFLEAIRVGRLAHATMENRPVRARVYGEVAVVTSRGTNTGTFLGEPLAADEWITQVWVRSAGEWRCALTHLTPAAP